jgi:peptide deformylase
MAIRQVLHYPDPRLRTKAAPVTVFDDALKTLVADMFDTMYAEDGAGLAATQIDVHQQVIVVDMSADKSQQLVWINPDIIEMKGECLSDEGCLSVPGVWSSVPRAEEVTFSYQDIDGLSHTLTVNKESRLALAIQHENDHLQGIVYVDRLSPLKRKMLLKKMEKLNKHEKY